MVQLVPEFSDPEITKLITDYLSEPSDMNFYHLSGKLIDNNEFIDIMYNICLSTLLKPLPLKHLIRTLFLSGRFIETLYYCHHYRKKFSADIEIARISTMAKIEAGTLEKEEILLKENVELGEEKQQELTLRLSYNLRLGDLDRAHLLSMELFFEPNCLVHGYVAIIEAAVRLEDINLLYNALIEAKNKGIELKIGRAKENKIKKLLLNGFTRILIGNLRKKELSDG